MHEHSLFNKYDFKILYQGQTTQSLLHAIAFFTGEIQEDGIKYMLGLGFLLLLYQLEGQKLAHYNLEKDSTEITCRALGIAELL